MISKREAFEMAMRFFTYKKIDNSFDLSIQIARAVDGSVDILDISDLSYYYDLSFGFSDGTVASY